MSLVKLPKINMHFITTKYHELFKKLPSTRQTLTKAQKFIPPPSLIRPHSINYSPKSSEHNIHYYRKGNSRQINNVGHKTDAYPGCCILVYGLIYYNLKF